MGSELGVGCYDLWEALCHFGPGRQGKALPPRGGGSQCTWETTVSTEPLPDLAGRAAWAMKSTWRDTRQRIY